MIFLNMAKQWRKELSMIRNLESMKEGYFQRYIVVGARNVIPINFDCELPSGGKANT